VDAQTGLPVGNRFLVAGTGNSVIDPDVAYDDHNDRFIVVFSETNGVDYFGIGAVVLYGEYQSSQVQHPDYATVAITGAGEYGTDPAIAYNTEDHVFMIVFDGDTGGIRGRIAEINASLSGDLQVSADPSFSVQPEGDPVYAPDITWSGKIDRFFAVWESVPPSGESTIAGAALYDTLQTSGPQKASSTYLVGGPAGTDKSCFAPSLAYDPVNDHFITVFSHAQGSGLTDPNHIKASFINSSLTSLTTLVPVETTIDGFSLDHLSPQVTYTGIGGVMHAVYITAGQDLFGNQYHYIKSRNLRVDESGAPEVSGPLYVLISAEDQYLRNPAISGSHNGRSLIAWEEEEYILPIPDLPYDWKELHLDTDYDIFAQRIAPYWVQLPVMMKK
jgi:hypothetical protein